MWPPGRSYPTGCCTGPNETHGSVSKSPVHLPHSLTPGKCLPQPWCGQSPQHVDKQEYTVSFREDAGKTMTVDLVWPSLSLLKLFEHQPAQSQSYSGAPTPCRTAGVVRVGGEISRVNDRTPGLEAYVTCPSHNLASNSAVCGWCPSCHWYLKCLGVCPYPQPTSRSLSFPMPEQESQGTRAPYCAWRRNKCRCSHKTKQNKTFPTTELMWPNSLKKIKALSLPSRRLKTNLGRRANTITLFK